MAERATSAMRIAFSAILFKQSRRLPRLRQLLAEEQHRCIQSIIRVRILSLTISLYDRSYLILKFYKVLYVYYFSNLPHFSYLILQFPIALTLTKS